VTAPRIVLLGDICIDLLLAVDMYPEHGADGMAERLDMQLGGGTNNSAITLSRLGVTAVPLACTGKDAWADYLLDRMAWVGVDIQYICTKPEATTGITIVAVTPDGERTMFSYRGANIVYSPQDVSEAAFDGAGWLHLSAYALLEPPQRDALWRAVELAHSRKIPVSLDLNDDVVVRRPNEVLRLLPRLHTCILGRREVEWLGKDGGFERWSGSPDGNGCVAGSGEAGQCGLPAGERQNSACHFRRLRLKWWTRPVQGMLSALESYTPDHIPCRCLLRLLWLQRWAL
jgi:ribokinase